MSSIEARGRAVVGALPLLICASACTHDFSVFVVARVQSPDSGSGSGAGGAEPADASSGGREAAATGGVSSGGRSGTGGSTTPDAGPAHCSDKYGAAPSYTLCLEASTTCSFATHTAGGTCEALCSGFGGICLDQDNSSMGTCTATNRNDSCSTARDNAICLCTR
jgi:hypothetical protein